MDRYSQFVEGRIIDMSNRHADVPHAVWVEEVKRGDLIGVRRPAACGTRVIPQTIKKNGKRYLKPFDPASTKVCRQCLRCINSRLS